MCAWEDMWGEGVAGGMHAKGHVCVGGHVRVGRGGSEHAWQGVCMVGSIHGRRDGH